MKLQLSVAGDAHFTGYGDGYVAVSGHRYEHHLILAPGREVAEWNVAGFDALTPEAFEALAALGPEIIIFGSGATLRFPRPDVIRPLVQAGIGLEVMDTRAACRTYNILLSEGRRALAAILLA
jgi:uncharacterized protein